MRYAGKSNLVLIGMPGSGKSTIGRYLAKTYDMSFVDSDALIERACNMPIQQVVNRLGLKRFRQIEQQVLCDSDCENTVISTGGSAVYSDLAMQVLGRTAVRLYLQISRPTLIRRVNNQNVRGLLKYPSHSLMRLYADRENLYSPYADVTFNNDSPFTALRATELCDLLRG